MTGVHLRKHEAVQDYGSYEVWFDDGRPSKFFYFDDLPNRRLRPMSWRKRRLARRPRRSLLPNGTSWKT